MLTTQVVLRECCNCPGAVTRRRRFRLGPPTTRASGIVPLVRAVRLVARSRFSVLLVVFTAMWLGGRAQAATLTVTSSAPDTLNGADNICSLREAITNINDWAPTYLECTNTGGAYGDSDTINLPAGTYTLTIPNRGEDLNATGDLDIYYASLKIYGSGAANTIVQACDSTAGPCTGIDRVFQIDPLGLGINVEMSALTVRNGLEAAGGGIANGYNGYGMLTINNCTLSGNSAMGAGALGAGIYNDGTLNIKDCTLSGNSSSEVGGGIHNIGTMMISSSTLSDNSSGTGGGGIFNYGPLTISDSALSRNSARHGGGIFHGDLLSPISHPLIINNSTLSGNTATERGGGIWNDSRDTVTISDSTLSDNSATEGGGGIYHANGPLTISNSRLFRNTAPGSSVISTGGGGIASVSGTVTISNSALYLNTCYPAGGGIRNAGGTVTISNSTLSGNDGRLNGGGIANSGGTVTISNSTLWDNFAGNISGGGGISNASRGTVNIKSSIVANSISGGDCFGFITSLGVNYATDLSCSGFTRKTSGELNLGTLQFNLPGTTETHALLSGSVAINTASDCTDFGGSPVTQDQRGVPRPQGAQCDVGAYEAKCVPQPQGMVAWYTGDDRSASDFLGNHDGVIVNEINQCLAYVGGGSLAFNNPFNPVQYIEVQHDSDLDPRGHNFSIDLWINTTTPSGQPLLIKGYDVTHPAGYALGMIPGGKVYFGVSDGNSTNVFAQDQGSNIVVGQWHHVAGTFSRTGSSATANVYVDGILRETATNTTFGTAPIDGTTSCPLRIGADPSCSAPTDFFYGCMDEIEIFNRALDQRDIEDIFNGGSVGKCKCEPLADGSGCTTTCPDPNDTCRPTERVFDPVSGWIVTKCDCTNEKECYLEDIGIGLPGVCRGLHCPGTNSPCELTVTENCDGTLTYGCCRTGCDAPVRLIPDLETITFWESTFNIVPNLPTPSEFSKCGPELTTTTQPPGILTSGNSDFEGAPNAEFYDVFYSDADGTFNLDGKFVTIEAMFDGVLPSGGGLNIAEVELNFTTQPSKFANSVESFVGFGDNYIPLSEQFAVDGDLLTDTTMGNTSAAPPAPQRLRVTVGFPCSCEPLDDGSACTQMICPDSCVCVGGPIPGHPCDCGPNAGCGTGVCQAVPAKQCKPTQMVYDPSTGQTTITKCDCVNDDMCSIVSGTDAPRPLACQGVSCPVTGLDCPLSPTATLNPLDGTTTYECCPKEQYCRLENQITPDPCESFFQQPECTGSDPVHMCLPKCVEIVRGPTGPYPKGDPCTCTDSTCCGAVVVGPGPNYGLECLGSCQTPDCAQWTDGNCELFHYDSNNNLLSHGQVSVQNLPVGDKVCCGCVNLCLNPPVKRCHDVLFCNGCEIANPNPAGEECIAGDPPCEPEFLCDEEHDRCLEAIPTVSEWGLVVLTLLLLLGAKIYFARRKTAKP